MVNGYKVGDAAVNLGSLLVVVVGFHHGEPVVRDHGTRGAKWVAALDKLRPATAAEVAMGARAFNLAATAAGQSEI